MSYHTFFLQLLRVCTCLLRRTRRAIDHTVNYGRLLETALIPLFKGSVRYPIGLKKLGN